MTSELRTSSGKGELLQGRVLRSRSGFVEVQTGRGTVRCRVRGRLKQGKQRSDLCVVGDQVELMMLGDGDGGVIERVLPRRTRFSRRHPGPGGRWREDVLVANLDQVVCIFCFGAPAFHPRLLDRFLVVAEHNGVDALLVANKLDLMSSEQERAAFETYGRIGYPVAYTSAITGDGIDTLRARLQGRTSAFAGPSGVGKSHLLNVIEPGLDLQVGAVSESVNKGRHTTRVATLHPLTGSGYVADTPGVRELGTWRIPPEELDACFREMRPWLGACAFGDCRHLREPSCAVREAVETGEVSRERYDSYVRMLLEEEA